MTDVMAAAGTMESAESAERRRRLFSISKELVLVRAAPCELCAAYKGHRGVAYIKGIGEFPGFAFFLASGLWAFRVQGGVRRTRRSSPPSSTQHTARSLSPSPSVLSLEKNHFSVLL